MRIVQGGNMRLKTQVVVIGGGPSGVCAAVAAARHGADVILIEKEAYCGGMATAASVPAFSPYSNGGNIISDGMAMEIKSRMIAISPELEADNRKWQPIDPEALKRVYDDMLTEAGVNVLYHSVLVDVTVVEQCVKEVVIESVCGKIEIEAQYFIDCTGNAELIYKTGIESLFGDERNRVQALTLCFRLGNVDITEYKKYLEETGNDGNLNEAVKKAKQLGDFDIKEEKVCAAIIQNSCVVGMNFGHEYEVNPLNPFDLSVAEMEARRKIPQLLRFIKKYVPGFEKAQLVSSGPNIGVRETRRVIGHYQLNEKDYYNRTVPNDVIAISCYPIDLHPVAFEENKKGRIDEYNESRYNKGEYYGIPYRTLIPLELINVGIAGRTISADRKTHGSVRLMNTCQLTGQAIGTAAALLVDTKTAMIDVSIYRLQEILRGDGCNIPQIEH